MQNARSVLSELRGVLTEKQADVDLDGVEWLRAHAAVGLTSDERYNIAVARRVVLALDHRGHGLSDKPAAGYSVGEMALDTRAVLDHAGIEGAVGHYYQLERPNDFNDDLRDFLARLQP